MNREDAFLRALYSASGLVGSGRLNAERVNDLGETLQIPRGEILQLVERLHSDGLVTVHWGGELSLTSKGIQHARGEAAGRSGAPGGIAAGRDVYVVQGSPNAAIGPGAMGAGTIRIEAPAGDLVVALQVLRAIRPDLSKAAQEDVQALEGELQATIQETQQPAQATTDWQVSQSRTSKYMSATRSTQSPQETHRGRCERDGHGGYPKASKSR
jgi:hypothetical protein